MPRTLDEVIEGYESARSGMMGLTANVLPPTTLLSTPPPSAMLNMGMPPPMMYSPAMQSMQPPLPIGLPPPMMTPQYPSSINSTQQLVARAMPPILPTPQMPQLGPMGGMGQMGYPSGMMPSASPIPILRGTAGMTGQFSPAGNEEAYRTLGRTAGYLDPSKATDYARQMWGQKAQGTGETVGSTVGSFIPGIGGLVGGVLGGPVGGAIANNPLTRWMFGPSERASQHMSMMANLQHRTFGNMQLTGGDVGLGGAGMSGAGAMQLGQQYTGIAERWGRRYNADEKDVQKYKQDMVRMTEMAAQSGLLDASTNIDQISDTVLKLMKVMGRMAKVTGDPDFRNNLKEIAQLRTMGFTIDQAVETTRNIAYYAKGAGVSREQIMAQGGQVGMQAWAQMGLAPGIGMVHGAAAQTRARQLAGAFDPYTQMTMGGQEGIQGHIATMGAQFAGGPAGQMMLGAAMRFDASGKIVADPDRIQKLMRQGTTVAGLASESIQNLHAMVREAQQRNPGMDPREAYEFVVTNQRQLLSQMAQDPEKLRMMQLGLAASFKRGGMNWTESFNLAGGGEEGGKILRELATNPEVRDRMRIQRQEQLSSLRAEAKKEYESQRQERNDWRLSMNWESVPIVGGVRRLSRFVEQRRASAAAREAEGMLREQMEQEDEERGTSSAYVGRTNVALMTKMEQRTQKLAERGGLVSTAAGGIDRFAQMRQRIERGETAWTGRGAGRPLGVSDEMMEAAQRAQGILPGGGIFGNPIDRATAWGFRKNMELANLTKGAFGYEMDEALSYQTGYRNIAINTLETASVIEKTKDKTVADIGTQIERMAGGLATSLGGDPSKMKSMLWGVGKQVAAKAEIAAKSGEQGFSLKQRYDVYREAMRGMGMSEARIEKSLKEYGSKWDEMAVGWTQVFGSDEARAQLATSLGLGAETVAATQKEDIKTIQTRLDRGKQRWLNRLAEVGITGTEAAPIFGERVGGMISPEGKRMIGQGAALSAEQEEGIGAVKTAMGEGGAEQAAALMTYAAATGGTGPEKEIAEKSLEKLMFGTPAQREMAAKAKAQYEALKQKGGKKGAAFLADLTKLGRSQKGLGPMDYEKTVEHLKMGSVNQTGLFGGMFVTEGETIAAKEQGYELKDGKIVAAGTTAGTKAEAEAEKVEKEIEALDEIAKSFPDAVDKLKISSDAMLSAAKTFGSNVEKEMEFLRDKLGV